jgi:hypothetical protein
MRTPFRPAWPSSDQLSPRFGWGLFVFAAIAALPQSLVIAQAYAKVSGFCLADWLLRPERGIQFRTAIMP